MADEHPDFQNLDIKGRANGLRYRQRRELADKATRRRNRRWGQNPESAGRARTCPVHAVLARFSVRPLFC